MIPLSHHISEEMASLSRFLNGMDEASIDVDEQRRNLLDALRFFIGKICEKQLSPKVPSHEFVSALTGLSFTLLNDHLPKELLAFSRHAGRKAVQDEDFLLYARKTSLQQHLKEYRELLVPEKPKKKPGRKSNKTIEEILEEDSS